MAVWSDRTSLEKERGLRQCGSLRGNRLNYYCIARKGDVILLHDD